MSHSAPMSRLLLLVFVLLVAGPKHQAQTPSPTLTALQRDFAMRYLEPEPHMALAKYYFDHGNRIVAFFTLEAARRERFEEKIFDPAFYRAFDGFDNSNAGEARLLAEFAHQPDSADTIHDVADIYISREDYVTAKRYLLIGIQKHPEDYRFTGGLAVVLGRQGKQREAEQLDQDFMRKFPNSAVAYAARAEALTKTNPLEARIILAEALKRFPNDGQLLFDLAVVYEGEDYQKAEETFVKAAELAPKSEMVQTWVGRFFFKARSDNRRALPYYLNAYFLNPHAYETEFVESRIRTIAAQLAAEELEKQTKAGVSLTKLLADPNPVVVSQALVQLSEQWQLAYVEPVVRLMGHDDGGLRWEATQLLKTKVDNSFDAQLRDLLKDDDLRKRGLAAYIAVYRWKSDSFAAIKSLLTSESQLVRYDAISALMMEGGPAGRQIVHAHAAREPNATLKKLIETAKP